MNDTVNMKQVQAPQRKLNRLMTDSYEVYYDVTTEIYSYRILNFVLTA